MEYKGMTINVHGCDGSFWCVHGPGSGAQGVHLGKDQVQGLFEAPVRTSWKSAARQDGGKAKGKWFEWRDLALGFHVLDKRVPGASFEDIDSAFRQAFDYEEDPVDHDSELAKIEVITPQSTRWLYVQQYQQVDFNPGVDPLLVGYGNPIIALRAGQPFWESTPVVSKWSTTATSGNGYVYPSNPTGRFLRHKWILTRGTWILPDVSWEGKPWHRRRGVSKQTGRDDRNRGILMPALGVLEGGATVDLDRMKLMVRDAHGTNLLGRMPVPGRYFEHPLPPRLQDGESVDTRLPVSVSDAPPGGAMCQLVMRRLWQRPIGGV